MGLVKYMAKEFFKEIDNKSREFFEFVLPPIDLHQEGDNFIVTVDIPVSYTHLTLPTILLV